MKKTTLMLLALCMFYNNVTHAWKPASASIAAEGSSISIEDKDNYIRSYIRNKTPYPLVFRAVGDASDTDIPTEPFTLKPNEYILVNIYKKGYDAHPGSDYHIDVSTEWADNAQLFNNISQKPLPQASYPYWNDPAHYLYGGGSRVNWGVQFLNNPRGDFVITKFNENDPNGHLRLAKEIDPKQPNAIHPELSLNSATGKYDIPKNK